MNMRKIKLFFLTLALLVGGGNSIWAQKDVTSQYITNAGFESCTAETNDKPTGSNIDYANNGWTISSETGAQSCGAVVSYAGVNVNSVAAPATDNAGNSGNALGVSVGWTQSVTYKTANVTLPAGYYILRANVYNNNPEGTTFVSKLGFVTSSTSYLSSSPSYPYASWVKDEVAFYLSESTEGYFQIGGTAQNSSSSANAKAFFDNITLIYSDKQMDYTSSVAVGKDNWGGSGTYGSVTTRDGRTQALAEFYGSSDTGIKMSQKISGLRNGIYEATLFATSHNAWGNHSAALDADADDVAYVYALPEGGVTIQQFFKARHDGGMSKSEPCRVTISNITVDKGALTLGLGLAQSAKTEWQTLQIYSLTRTGDLDLTELVNGYNTALSAAKTAAATTKKVWSKLIDDLNTCINTYDTGKVDTQDADALEAATTALNNATAAVNTSIASYDIIASGTVSTSSLDGWTCTNSNAFHINTWSGEGNSDGSAMTNPFIENWVNKGTAENPSYLGAGTFSYTLEGLTPGEVYYAQALIRSYSELGNIPNGPNFFINGIETDLSTEGTECTSGSAKGKFATMGAVATVGADGKITLGAVIAADANYNWVAFKNVSIQSMDDALNAAIKKVTDLENTIPTSVYNTAYTVVTNNSGANKPASAAEYETAIAAIETAATTASAYVQPYSAWKTAKNNAETNYGSVALVTTVKNAQSTAVEAANDISDITNAVNELNNTIASYDAWVSLKASADALMAVANDNATANNTLATAISDQNTAAEAATTSAALESAVSTLKAAMVTYAGAANPVGDGKKFDLTFMLTNPDVSGFENGAYPAGWYCDYSGDAWHDPKVNRNATLASDPTKNATYEFWTGTAIATNEFTVYQKVTLSEGTYQMNCLAFADANGVAGATNNQVYFYANDTQGSKIESETNHLADASISFVNNSEQEVKIGLKALTGNQYRWMGMGYVELYKVPAQAFIISEDIPYETTQEGAGNVTLTRTIKENAWNTIWLPFSMTEEELKSTFGNDVQIAEYEEVDNDDNSTINFNVMATPAISPLKPVLLKTSTAGTSYTINARTLVAGTPSIIGTNFDFVGTTAASTIIAKDNYFIGTSTKDDKSKLFKSSGETTIKGTRAYLKANSTKARIIKLSIDGEEVTAVEGIKVVGINNGKIYNLNGQEVKNAQKGIFIQNGKKIVVK